jgi:hypothetical protein
MKVIAKTESFSEFLARGGKVTKYPTKSYKKPTRKQTGYEKAVEVSVEPDLSALPKALKISFGIK